MKILCLSTWFPYPPDNGSKIRAYYLIGALTQAGHDVTVVAFRPFPGPAASDLAVPDPDRTDIYAVRDDPYRHVSASKLVRYASPLPLAFRRSRPMQLTVKSLARTRWDGVVVFQTPAGRYALQLPPTARVQDIDTSLGYQMHERYEQASTSPAQRLQRWVSWRKAYWFEKRQFRKFHTCVVASPAELSYLRAMSNGGTHRITLVPNGVDCRHNVPGLAQPQAGALVFNGALTYAANYDAMQYFLADIFPQIRAEAPEAALTVTGSTAGVNLSALPPAVGVSFSGYVPDIRPVVAGAQVCVVPLREGGGTRIKILEAMALGTPVVATSKGAEGLEVEPGRHLLLADEPAAFAEQTLHVLREPALRSALAREARLLVEARYDWHVIGRHFANLVERTVVDFGESVHG